MYELHITASTNGENRTHLSQTDRRFALDVLDQVTNRLTAPLSAAMTRVVVDFYTAVGQRPHQRSVSFRFHFELRGRELHTSSRPFVFADHGPPQPLDATRLVEQILTTTPSY